MILLYSSELCICQDCSQFCSCLEGNVINAKLLCERTSLHVTMVMVNRGSCVLLCLNLRQRFLSPAASAYLHNYMILCVKVNT